MSAIAKQSKAAGKKRSKSQETWRRFKKNTRAVVGLGIVAVRVLCAVLAASSMAHAFQCQSALSPSAFL